MVIEEELKDPKNKKKFRELVKKYHPDKGGEDEETIKRINHAKRSDKDFEAFLKDFLNDKKEESPKEESPKEKPFKSKTKPYRYDFKSEVLKKQRPKRQKPKEGKHNYQYKSSILKNQKVGKGR